MEIVYFSNVTENTHTFVQKLEASALRIPLHRNEAPLVAEQPYVLVVPTYGGGHMGGSVPKQVVQFLNVENNRELLRGVIASGNLSFGTTFCRAGDVISWKCQVPLLYQFELRGTDHDVSRVQTILETL